MSVEDRRAANLVAQQALKDPTILHDDDLSPLRDLVESLGGKLPAKPAPKAEATPAAAAQDSDSEPDDDRWEAVPLGDDYIFPTADPTANDADEIGTTKKGEAQDAINDGKLEEAVQLMNVALTNKPHSAMYWAFRADLHLKLKRTAAALKDAEKALEINPENARAHRVKGTVNRHLGKWEEAAKDLNLANQIDCTDAVTELLKVVQPRANKRRDARRKTELREQEDRQERLRKQREDEQRQEQEEQAKARAEQAGAGGFPGGMPGMGGMPGGMPGGMGGMPGGMPGGMGGMPGGMPNVPPGLMEALMSDPELQAAMQDPEVSQKLMSCMSNPMAAAQLMQDPKCGPVLQKLFAKMGGGMGGMPGMGGMGGMPGGMGGMGGAGGAAPEQPPQAEPKPSGAGARRDDLD